MKKPKRGRVGRTPVRALGHHSRSSEDKDSERAGLVSPAPGQSPGRRKDENRVSKRWATCSETAHELRMFLGGWRNSYLVPCKSDRKCEFQSPSAKCYRDTAKLVCFLFGLWLLSHFTDEEIEVQKDDINALFQCHTICKRQNQELSQICLSTTTA